jgi:hypothetical protein
MNMSDKLFVKEYGIDFSAGVEWLYLKTEWRQHQAP